jgi:hypothetical protein
MEMSAFSAKSAWESPRLARNILMFLPKVSFMACPSMSFIPCNPLIQTYIALIDKTQIELYSIEQTVFLALFTGF